MIVGVALAEGAFPIQAEPSVVLEATNEGPNSALWTCLVVAFLALVWFLVKWRAGARWGSDSPAVRLYNRCDPWVQALRSWLALAPVTFVYIATWTVTTVIFQGTPTTVAGVLNRFNSTNIMGIVTEPVRVLFSSAFIVADYGFFYLGYVAVYVLIISRLEQRIGSARVVLVGAGAHVAGSLVIVALESVLIRSQLLAPATVVTQDVGVSYVMVGCSGAYLFVVGKAWRWWFASALLLTVVVPLIVVPTLWDLGHFLATAFGIAIFLLVRRWGMRPALKWRTMATGRTPRPLPTWSSTTEEKSGVGTPSD